MAKWTGKKVQVAFDKPKDPSFLTDFKRRTGYREDGGMSDKFAEMPPAMPEDLEDDESDLPQVVGTSGRSGLSAAELEKLQEQGKLQTLLATGSAQQNGEDAEEGDQKIVFRKPGGKRPLEDSEEAPTVPTAEDSEVAAVKDKTNKKCKKKKKRDEEKKKKLLSFDDEIDEEE